MHSLVLCANQEYCDDKIMKHEYGKLMKYFKKSSCELLSLCHPQLASQKAVSPDVCTKTMLCMIFCILCKTTVKLLIRRLCVVSFRINITSQQT